MLCTALQQHEQLRPCVMPHLRPFKVSHLGDSLSTLTGDSGQII